MAKLGKEVEGRKHNIRRVLIALTAVVGVAAIGVGVAIASATSPLLIAFEVALVGTGIGLVSGTAIAIHKSNEVMKVRKSAKNAEKSLNEIQELNTDYSTKKSREYRAKVIQKYAKANLKLAEITGASKFGVFRSNVGIVDDKKAKEAVGYFTKIDALTLLKDTEKSNRKKEKYSKKIKLLNNELTKVVSDDGLVMPPYRWTKTYDDVLPDVSVLDRRTEVATLTEKAKDSYASLVEGNTPANNKILNVIVKFNSSSALASTFARSEDETTMESVKDVMLKDVFDYCKGKSSAEIRALFPIVVESKISNKKNTKIVNANNTVVRSYTELQKMFTEKTTDK